VPADGPPAWTSGTLFPQSSKKIARAINAASGNRPVVVLANLSGFDGSPESMRKLQLEYGAEIGRAVTNFDGPIVFVVVSRYHGGAFVVFSKTLNEQLEIAAVEGSYASVIGGAPAAGVVFAREVTTRAEQDPQVVALRAAVSAGTASRAELAELFAEVRAGKLGEMASEFDAVHSSSGPCGWARSTASSLRRTCGLRDRRRRARASPGDARAGSAGRGRGPGLRTGPWSGLLERRGVDLLRGCDGQHEGAEAAPPPGQSAPPRVRGR
jgi:hypothetical protein